ncbi:YggT family protein [Reinekea thalattae]|uniref:YggT family protein n=1 Tax=Reinekea thalattae TaxID=2593301 RepID=A0A5C8Z3D3_9GAMM|nr:YggT family protein [Reinekea thalattae]TXR51440.1 YggT family protein [Reinekea thalattae]
MFLIQMILSIAFNIVLVSLVARFLAQMARADFYNPLAQTVVKITDPFLKPARRIIPSVAGLDMASLILIILGQLLYSVLILLINGVNPSTYISTLVIGSLIASGVLILWVIYWSMIIVAIASFILMGQHNPFVYFISQMIEPFVGPFRRLNLQIGVLDLSFILAIIVIYLLKDFLLLQTIGPVVGYTPRLFVGG